jgi:hypothetical protein
VEKSFRIWLRVVWILTILSVLAILWVVVVAYAGHEWRDYVALLLFSVPMLFFSAFILPMLYYYRKKYTKGADELMGGKYLAHWTYEADEWNKFVEGEWKRTKKQAIWTPFGIIAVVIVLGYLFKGWGVDDFKIILPWILGLSIIVAIFMYYVGRRTYRKGIEKVGEVFIGDHAVQFNGNYCTWDYFGAKLGKVELLKADPPILQFEIRQIGRYGSKSTEVRVPVPRKHEKEAAELVLKFSS